MQKHGPIGILDQLTPEQQDELFLLCEKHEFPVVVKMIATPQPEGWGMVVHLAWVRRFYQRKQLQNVRSDLAANADLEINADETEKLRESLRAAVTRHACQLATSSPADSKSADKAFRYLMELEKLAAKAQHLKLLRSRLKLEKSKAQFNAIVKATSPDSPLRGEEHKQMVTEFQLAVMPGRHLNPSVFQGFGIFHDEDLDEE